jgi:3-dehydroquinate synthase
MAETRTVSLGDRTYDIFFDGDIYPVFQEWICRFYPGGSVHVVTDRNVAAIYGDDIRRWLAGIPHDVLALPAGEENKQAAAVGSIYDFLVRGDAGRDSLVVAFGGGVVGDLAGYAAATYLRGVAYVQIPTTLLSQVDSSVGGKTGYNLPEGKNLVGAFHQPRAVFIDDTFLLTLDERNLRSGLAEVIKCALAGDAELWDRMVARGRRWKSFSGSDWQWLIRRAVGFKASVVEKDERESSLRKILNLGHTIGHAMEKAGGYGRVLHGEAVAMGLAWEAILGNRLGVTPAGQVDAIVSLLLETGYELDDAGMPLSTIAAAIGTDKKRVRSEVDLPLVIAPGRWELRRVPLSEIRREIPGIRAEIRERSAGLRPDARVERDAGVSKPSDIADGISEAVRALERRVAANPRDNQVITLLADAYRRSGNVTAAWEAIQVVLERNPADAAAQRVAADLGKPVPESSSVGERPAAALPLESLLIVGDDAYEIQSAVEQPGESGEVEPAAEPHAGIVVAEQAPSPAAPSHLDAASAAAEEGPGRTGGTASLPPAPVVRTVTLAEVYWWQGERETARAIVREILREDPGNDRALAWLAAHDQEDPVEAALGAFLETAAKEYGYDLSRYH